MNNNMADQQVTSVGLMGLPHYRASRVSMEMYEPVYQNLFTVEFQLPAGLSHISEGDKNLLLEGVRKVEGLDTNKVPAVTTQSYKFAQRSFAGSGTDTTVIDLKLDFEINVRGSATGNPEMYTLKILRAWDDLIWDPLTGRQGLKVNYVAPSMTITVHDKANQPFWQWICYNVFPTAPLPAPALNYDTKTDLYKVTGWTLRCDYWDEIML